MKLTIFDRIILHELLPTNSDYKTLKQVMEFREKELKFDRDETEKYDISQERTSSGFVQVRFNREVAENYSKEVKIPTLVKAAIVNKLKELDSTKQLREDLIPIYEKFVA